MADHNEHVSHPTNASGKIQKSIQLNDTLPRGCSTEARPSTIPTSPIDESSVVPTITTKIQPGSLKDRVQRSELQLLFWNGTQLSISVMIVGPWRQVLTRAKGSHPTEVEGRVTVVHPGPRSSLRGSDRCWTRSHQGSQNPR